MSRERSDGYKQLVGFDDDPSKGQNQCFQSTGLMFSMEMTFSIILCGVFGLTGWKLMLLCFGLLLYRSCGTLSLACIFADRGVNFALLTQLMPSILMGGWITFAYLQCGVNPYVPAGADPAQSNRTCYYHEELKEIESFYTKVGLENHTVHYPFYTVKCQAKHKWADFIASMLPTLFPLGMQFGLPLLFMSMTLGAVKTVAAVAIDAEMYIYLQFVVLNFFDLMDFLIIGFTPANFNYLAGNSIWGTILPVSFLFLTVNVILQVALAFKSLPDCIVSDEKRTSRAQAGLSLCIDIPLGFLRFSFKMNGLEITMFLAAKNAFLMVGDLALMYYGNARNPVNYQLAQVLTFLPGAQLLIREARADFTKHIGGRLKDEHKNLEDKTKLLRKMELRSYAERIWSDTLRAIPIDNHVAAENAFKSFCDDHTGKFTATSFKEMIEFCFDKFPLERPPGFLDLKKNAKNNVETLIFLVTQRASSKEDDAFQTQHFVLGMDVVAYWIFSGQIDTAPWT